MGVFKNDTLIEQSIYGSSRLGLMTSSSKTGYRTLGGKKYELSNHLGNVLARYPWYTPYQHAGNNPIKFIDLDGLEEYDPQRDAFFTARLLLTTFYDINHYTENLMLNTFVPADPGMKWQASYKVNETGAEIFETVIRQVPRQGALKETFHTALDVVNVVTAGRLDPTDFVASKSGSNTQLTRGLRKFLDPASFSQLPNGGLSSIRFSQGSISPNFRDGTSVDDLVSGLRNGLIDRMSVDPIRIV